MLATFLALSFLVQPLADPALLDVIVEQRSPAITKYARPSTIALSRRGRLSSVAKAGTDLMERLLVVEKDGRRRVFRLPDIRLLSKAFFAYAPEFPGLTIADVVARDDGPFFATASMVFSGAFGGTEEAVFGSNDGAWSALSTTRHGIDNAALVAVDEDGTTLWAADSLNESPAVLARKPQYAALQGPVTMRRGSIRTVVGTGIPEAVRDGVACGTRIEADGTYTAVTWGRSRVRLGHGIAWDLTGPEYVVGDDRLKGSSYGHPVLWWHGRTMRLSDRVGAAYGISRDGMIVGSVDNDAFFVAPGDVRRRLVIVDSSLRDHGWHVSSVFAVSDDHTMVALASKGSSQPQVVLLKPTSKGASHRR